MIEFIKLYRLSHSRFHEKFLQIEKKTQFDSVEFEKKEEKETKKKTKKNKAIS